MRDHEVLSSIVRELERLRFGTQAGPKRAIRSSTSFLRQSHMGVRDTLCRTVWMQTFQESKGQYGWTESSTFLVLPKAGYLTCSFRHAIGTGRVLLFTKHLWVRVWSCCLVHSKGASERAARIVLQECQRANRLACFEPLLFYYAGRVACEKAGRFKKTFASRCVQSFLGT